MNEKQLREAANCLVCEKPFVHTGLPFFWRITVERFAIDLNAIQRQDGLAEMLGSSFLANIMGADQEMAKRILEPVTVTVCEKCALEPLALASVIAKIGG